jgi:hypothetical protein
MKRSSAKLTTQSVRRMSREAKVNLAVEMTSAIAAIIMDSIRYRHPGISKKKLFELTRRRLHRHQPVSIIEVLAHILETRRPRRSNLAGKHIAIVGDVVVASGESPIEVWKKARKLHPESKPVLSFVPKDDVFCYTSKRGKLSDFAGSWKLTDQEMKEVSEGLRGTRSSSFKLSDTVGSKTISKEDWRRAQAVIRDSETKTKRRLKKNYFGIVRGIGPSQSKTK